MSVEWKDDKYHVPGSTYYRDLLRLRVQLLTSDYVLDETITRLRRDARLEIVEACWQRIKEAQKYGYLNVLSVDNSVRDEAFEILRKYREQTFSFTDCTSFVLAQKEQVDEVFSFDDHFRQFGLIIQPV